MSKNNKNLKKSVKIEVEKILDKKEYQISTEDSDYSLKVEIDNKYIHFSLYEINKISNYNFRNKFELSQIITKLNLVQTKYTSLPKIINFIDKAYSKNKIFIEQSTENEISLIFEIPVDYEEGKFSLILKKRNLEDKELLPILIEHINRLNNNNHVVKNKFNEIEKQINSISRKNTINRGSEGNDINEEINIIKQQLNDINIKLSGTKSLSSNPKTRNNFDRISAIKSSVSKNTENNYNNTYKSHRRKKSQLSDEKEDEKIIYEKDKNKKIYNNDRYNDNNDNIEEESNEENFKKNKKILNANKSKEKNNNGNKNEYINNKIIIRKSQKEPNELKKSERYNNKNDNYNDINKDDSDNDSNNDIRNSNKTKLRNERSNKKEKYNNNNNENKNIYVLPDSNNNSSEKYSNSKNGKKYVNNIYNSNKNDKDYKNKYNNNIKYNNLKKENESNNNISKMNQSKEININNIIRDNKNDDNKLNQSNSSEIKNEKNTKKITYVQKNKKEIEDYTNKTNYIYRSSPIKFNYKMDICKNNTSCGWNDMFEIYISYQNNKEYLASPDNNNFNINIISLDNNKLQLSLEGHKNRVRTIRYFINEYNNGNETDNKSESKIIYEYLISADDNHIIIVWDVLNNYEIKQKIDTNYEDDIYSCLIYFNMEDINQNYIISSSYNTSNDIQNAATKIYSLETGKYIFHIKESNYDNIYYLLMWYNKKGNKYYLIQFSYKKIIINSLDPKESEPYAKLVNEPENEHYSGFIFSKKDTELLCSSCYNGFIHVWDLYSKKIVNVIDTKCILCHIIPWSEKYVIVADFENKTFIIINLDKKEIYNDITVEHTMEVKCVKKLLHPKFGECLLTAGRDNAIKLWIL